MPYYFPQILSIAASKFVVPACTQVVRHAASCLTNPVSAKLPAAKRFWFSTSLLMLLLTMGRCVSAQQVPTEALPQSSLGPEEAKRTMESAVKPIGEEQAIRNLDSCVATGSFKQGESVGTFTWKTAGQESWGETVLNSIHIVAASNHGKPMRSQNGKISELPKSTLVNPVPLYNVGMTLLRSKDDPSVAIDVPPLTGDSAKGIRITQSKPKDANIEPVNETWISDPQTGLPASHLLKPFKYRGHPSGPTVQYKFSDYREVSGVKVPRHIELYMNDQLVHSYD